MLQKVERPYQFQISQVIGFELILLTLLPLTHQLAHITRFEALTGKGGGWFGWALSEPLLAFLGPILTGLFYLMLMLFGVSLLFQINIDDIQDGLEQLSENLNQWAQQIAPQGETAVSPHPQDYPVAQDEEPELDTPAIPLVDEPEKSVSSTYRSKKLPPLSLLGTSTISGISDAEIEAKKEKIEQTLADFGLPAEVTQVKKRASRHPVWCLTGLYRTSWP